MECNQVRDLLMDYVKEGLDQDTRLKVEQHLMECGSCAREAHATRRFLTATQAAHQEPIVSLVNEIIEGGLRHRASDIHLQAEPQHILVRYRIDGVLHEDRRIDRNLWDPLFTRFAVLADFNVVERRAPQDGRILHESDQKVYDLRLSYVPTATGGKFVMRILDRSAVILDLERIGLSEEDSETLRGLCRLPNGLIIVTGPTGCGKTTLMYSLLHLMNSERANLTTIEDPVEYTFDNVAQIGLNHRAGVTFATALRAVLRQDPDVIMVGEIRDLETAELIVQAAITGHLVLTTLHAKEASSAINRLIDIGVEPFLIQSTLRGVVSLRLVRQICADCMEEVALSQEENERLLGLAPELEGKTFHRGCGCDLCHQTGYRGRTGIFEVLPINETISRLIATSPQPSVLRAAAIESGMVTMLRDGLRKASAGITTVEEVIRMASAYAL